MSRFRLVLLTCLLIPFAPPPSALAHGSHGGGGESLEPGEFNFSPLVTVEGHGGADMNLEGSPKHYAVDGLFGGVFEWGLENGGSIAVEAAVGPSLVWGEAEHFYGKVHTHGGHDHGAHGDSHGDSHSDHAGEHGDHDDHDEHDHGDHEALTKKERRQRRMLQVTAKKRNREGRLARLELRRLSNQSNDNHQDHDDHDDHGHDDHGHHARRSYRSADDDHDHYHDHDHDHADHQKRDREELLAHREHVNRLKARAYDKYNDDHAGHDDHSGHDDHGHGGHDGHGNPNFKRSDVRGFLSVRYAPNDRLSFAINWNPYYVTKNEDDDIKGLKNEVGANVVWALGDGDVDFALGDGLEDLVDGVFLSLDHRQGWESDGTYVGNYTDPRIGVGFNIDEVNITLDAGPRFYVPGSYSGLGQRTDFAAEVEVAIPVGDALIFAHWQPTYSGTDAPGWGVGWQHHIGTGMTFKF